MIQGQAGPSGQSRPPNLLQWLCHEGGDKSAIAARHVSENTAAYMREHCGIDVGRRGNATTATAGGDNRT